jgi:hypothetical protein
MKQPKIYYLPHSPFGFYDKKMKLGSDYMVRKDGKWYLCRFIKTTRKGFNLLDLNTNKCLRIPGHFYAKKWSGKEIPDDEVWFKVTIPEWIMVGAHVNKEESAG